MEVNSKLFKIKLFSKKPKLLTVLSPYYEDIGENLLKGSSEALERYDLESDVVNVPGAFEIPTAIYLKKDYYDGFIALGCIIRGETSHYDTVCNVSAHFLSKLGLKGICLGNGILNCENYSQALERSDPKKQNKGGNAAIAALSLVSLQQS